MSDNSEHMTTLFNVVVVVDPAQQMTKDFRPDLRDHKYTFADVQGVSTHHLGSSGWPLPPSPCL